MKKILLIGATIGLLGFGLILMASGNSVASSPDTLATLVEAAPQTSVTYTGWTGSMAGTFARLMNSLLQITSHNVVLAILLLAALVTAVALYPSIHLQIKQKKIHLFHRKLMNEYNHGKLTHKEVHGKLAHLYALNEKLHGYGAFLFTLQAMVFLMVFFALALISNAPHLIATSWGTTQSYLLAQPANFAIPLTVSLLYFLHSLIKISFKEHEDYINPTQSLIAVIFAILSATVVYFFSAQFAVLLSAYFMALVAFSTIRYLAVEYYAPRFIHKIHTALLHTLNKPIEEVTHWKKISLWFNHLPVIRHINLHLLEEAMSMSLGLVIALNFFGVFQVGTPNPLMVWVNEAKASYDGSLMVPCPSGRVDNFVDWVNISSLPSMGQFGADPNRYYLNNQDFLSTAPITDSVRMFHNPSVGTLDDFPATVCAPLFNNDFYQFVKDYRSTSCGQEVYNLGSDVLPRYNYCTYRFFRSSIGVRLVTPTTFPASVNAGGTITNISIREGSGTYGAITATGGTILDPTRPFTFTADWQSPSGSIRVCDRENALNCAEQSFSITPAPRVTFSNPSSSTTSVIINGRITGITVNGGSGQYSTPTFASSTIGTALVSISGSSPGPYAFTAGPQTGSGTMTICDLNNLGNCAALNISVTTALPTPPTLRTIVITPANASIAVGANQQFTAIGIDQNGQSLATQPTFNWSSSNNAVVIVDNAGFATGVTVGSANISANSGGISSLNATLTVTAAPVPLAFTAPTVTVGGSFTVRPSGGTRPHTSTYTSNPINGRVSGNVFEATAVGAGTLHICDSATQPVCIDVPVTIQAGALPLTYTGPSAVIVGERIPITQSGGTAPYVYRNPINGILADDTFTPTARGSGGFQMCDSATPQNCANIRFLITEPLFDRAMKTCPIPSNPATFLYQDIFANRTPFNGRFYLTPPQGNDQSATVRHLSSTLNADVFPTSICIAIPGTNNNYQFIRSNQACVHEDPGIANNGAPANDSCFYNFRNIPDVTLITPAATPTNVKTATTFPVSASGGSGSEQYTYTTTGGTVENNNTFKAGNQSGQGTLQVCDRNNASNCSAALTFTIQPAITFTSPNAVPTTARLGQSFIVEFAVDSGNTSDYQMTATRGNLAQITPPRANVQRFTATREGRGEVRVCEIANPTHCNAFEFAIQDDPFDPTGARECPPLALAEASRFVYEEIFTGDQPMPGRFYATPIQGTATETRLKAVASGTGAVAFPASVCLNIPGRGSYQLLRSEIPATAETTPGAHESQTYSLRNIPAVTLAVIGTPPATLKVGDNIQIRAAGGSEEFTFTSVGGDVHDNNTIFTPSAIGRDSVRACDANNATNCSTLITFDVRGCRENFRVKNAFGETVFDKNKTDLPLFTVYRGESYRLKVENLFTPNTFNIQTLSNNNEMISLSPRTPNQDTLEFQVSRTAEDIADGRIPEAVLLISDPDAVLSNGVEANRDRLIDSLDCWIQIPIKVSKNAPIQKQSRPIINLGSN